ncbi:MAG: glutamate-cysteine ligase family protein [Anaerolineales bacterium]
MRPSDPLLTAIAEQYVSNFRETLGPIRKVGREAEFPVVWPDGRAGDVSLLWEPLLAQGGLTPRYDDPGTRRLLVEVSEPGLMVAIEVGRGTVELSLGPYEDLWQLQTGFGQALARVNGAARERGMQLLGFGIQPRTPASQRLMTPARHYRALRRAAGTAWLRLTTSASDQLHVDITRAEIPTAVNWLNLLSGPVIALCANSSVYAGRVGRYQAGREAFLADLGKQRYGMPPRQFDTATEWIEYLSEFQCFVLPESTGFRRISRPFSEVLTAEGKRGTPAEQLFQYFLWHEHYVWNSARARVAHSTIEVRPACQQPPGESMAANALILGWVVALKEASTLISRALGPNPWPAMSRYRQAAVREGLGAPEPAPGLLAGLVEIARAGLKRRGRGEERLLVPIERRLAERQSPGQHAQQILRRSGMAALLEQLRLTP